MENEPPEAVSPEELKKHLDGQPILLRNLGYVANNAGVFNLFLELRAAGRDFTQIKKAIEDELRHQGISDTSDLLSLFDIPPDIFDDWPER
jgi:hypothetical protein